MLAFYESITWLSQKVSLTKQSTDLFGLDLRMRNVWHLIFLCINYIMLILIFLDCSLTDQQHPTKHIIHVCTKVFFHIVSRFKLKHFGKM